MALTDSVCVTPFSERSDQPVDLPRLVRLPLELRQERTERVCVAVLELLLPAPRILDRLQFWGVTAPAFYAMLAFGCVVRHMTWRACDERTKFRVSLLAEIVRKSL